MNEREFKAKLRRLLKPHCHIQSMSSYATNGTPDLWLSGKKADLWLEVKYDDKTKGSIKPKLTALQTKWLDDRYAEGRNVAVIVGTSTSEAIIYYNKNWNNAGKIRDTLDFLIKLILEDLG